MQEDAERSHMHMHAALGLVKYPGLVEGPALVELAGSPGLGDGPRVGANGGDSNG